MKKLTAAVSIILLSAVLLCGCALFNKPGDTADTDDYVTDADKEKIIASLVNEVDLDGMSLDELLSYYDNFLKSGNEALKGGAEYDLFYKDKELKNDPSAELDFAYPDDAQTALFSDGPWESKEVEELDISAGMSPDEKAEYDAMIKELDEFDPAEFKSSMDEMLQGIEGFEDYDPDTAEITGEPSFTNEWKNEGVTKNVPKPPFKDLNAVYYDGGVNAVVTGVRKEEAAAYAGQLKNAGFNNDVSENDSSTAGVTIYSFSGENAEGIRVSLSFVAGTLTITVNE